MCLGEKSGNAQLLTKSERLNADVTVLAITMPRLDGIEAVRLLRRWHPSARLVFLIARAALDAGGLGYVVKRFTSRNGNNRTIRNWNGSERSKLAAFHTPILAPDVITREIDVFPAEG